MNFFEKLKNRIKKFFNIENEEIIKALPSANIEHNHFIENNNVLSYDTKNVVNDYKLADNENKNFKEQYIVHNIQNFSSKPMDYLDMAIEQYSFALLDRYKRGKSINSYSTLIRLGIDEKQEKGNNDINEMALLKSLQNKTVLKQNNKSDRTYYHINPNKESRGQFKLYLNIERKNIAKVTDLLCNKYLKDDNIYLKIASDKLMEMPRVESMVFYVDDEKELLTIIKGIENAKTENSKLFENAEKGNIFLKDIKGYMKVVEEVNPKEDCYIGLDKNKQKHEDLSYNSMLAYALEDSYVDAMRQIVAKDANLTMKTQGRIDLSFQEYVSLVSEDVLSDEKKKKDFLLLFRNDLAKLQLYNKKLNIKGMTDIDLQKAKNSMNINRDRID